MFICVGLLGFQINTYTLAKSLLHLNSWWEKSSQIMYLKIQDIF